MWNRGSLIFLHDTGLQLTDELACDASLTASVGVLGVGKQPRIPLNDSDGANVLALTQLGPEPRDFTLHVFKLVALDVPVEAAFEGTR